MKQIFTVCIDGYDAQEIVPRYPFHSAAAKEVAEKLKLTEDRTCSVADGDGNVEHFTVHVRPNVYVRSR